MTTRLKSSSSTDGGARKRVCKACDRCRLKKSKCDGLVPCGRCETDNTICGFAERKTYRPKVYPVGYVELLENQQSQLVAGLQELYRRLINGEGWTESQLKDDGQGNPLIHDMLERLGCLTAENPSSSEALQAYVKALQQRVNVGEASHLQCEQSLNTFSDMDTQSSFEHTSPYKAPTLVNSFPTSRFASTPSSRSPPSRCTEIASALKTQPLSVPSQTQSTLLGQDGMTSFPNFMNLNGSSYLPMNDLTTGLAPSSDTTHHDQTGLIINNYLATKEWSGSDDLMQQYFNPTSFG